MLTLQGSSSPRRGADARELAITKDGALLAENGIIREVGPTRRIENLASARRARVIDATGRVVMPGFVDAGTDLLDAVKHGLRSWTSARLQMEVRRSLEAFARHGTTAIEAKLSDDKEAKVMETLSGAPLDIVATLSVRTAEQGGRLPKPRNLASMVCAHCGPGALSGDEANLFLDRARRAGFALRVAGDGAATLAVERGALVLENPRSLANSELELVASSSTIVSLNPLDWFFTARPRDFARKLVDAGIPIAFGSGFNSKAPRTLSMPVLLSVAVHGLLLTPAEAITAATVNAAHALSMPRAIGSLEPGRQADFVVFACSDYRDIPDCPGVNLISMVVKRGVILDEELR